ncbi:PREDICTED: cofilin/actin-depolymerizing factor homolog [Drosophila arizonae]|uniref:Cofilin/actin-depolymerizing factor homolog n=1 Tax=Drosophila arizonae TaxID=7263 RepID=A0ABM1PX71_DROAR|nr:PREDICTED: cofilin/actin-depolymerizing factor homolog [Drosophila arizonae]XP_017871807.1 PREDICTED: cofilin/actin-depolymerizing factor homolog [Drosophila arizonae]
MASGIEVSTECKSIFEEIRKLKQHRYVIYAIKQEREIIVDVVGRRNASYDDFLNDLRKGGPEECRYAVYDYAYHHQCQGASSTCLKEKLFLMLWCPMQAKIKDKMLYSSSFAALKKEFNGVQKYIQATELDEACRECVEEQLRMLDRN